MLHRLCSCDSVNATIIIPRKYQADEYPREGICLQPRLSSYRDLRANQWSYIWCEASSPHSILFCYNMNLYFGPAALHCIINNILSYLIQYPTLSYFYYSMWSINCTFCYYGWYLIMEIKEKQKSKQNIDMCLKVVQTSTWHYPIRVVFHTCLGTYDMYFTVKRIAYIQKADSCPRLVANL